MKPLTHAIAYLKAQLETLANNEPIHRQIGDIEQADLDLAIATDVALAISILEAAAALTDSLRPAVDYSPVE